MTEPAPVLNVPLGGEVVAELPLQWISDDLGIYSFVLLDKVAWVKASATSLLSRIEDLLAGGVDVIVTPEAKAITLAYELASRLGLGDFVVARKSRKAYMADPVSVEVTSITTSFPQRMWFGQEDLAALRGRRVLVVDDVVSTGATLAALFGFLRSIDCEVVGVACVLTEGETRSDYDGVPLISIGHIPLVHR
ncbi:MAG: adenine phosphoribosyltransferase [Actinobacteria bacterium]|nr:adenine phosphoribosyltransferase [Actinomycetota bacterium]